MTLGFLEYVPFQDSEDSVIGNRWRNGPRIVVEMRIGKEDNPILDELALRELSEFLRFPLDQRQLPVKSPSYAILALGEHPNLSVARLNR